MDHKATLYTVCESVGYRFHMLVLLKGFIPDLVKVKKKSALLKNVNRI